MRVYLPVLSHLHHMLMIVRCLRTHSATALKGMNLQRKQLLLQDFNNGYFLLGNDFIS
jgi:hypothetical protein